MWPYFNLINFVKPNPLKLLNYSRRTRHSFFMGTITNIFSKKNSLSSKNSRNNWMNNRMISMSSQLIVEKLGLWLVSPKFSLDIDVWPIIILILTHLLENPQVVRSYYMYLLTSQLQFLFSNHSTICVKSINKKYKSLHTIICMQCFILFWGQFFDWQIVVCPISKLKM